MGGTPVVGSTHGDVGSTERSLTNPPAALGIIPSRAFEGKQQAGRLLADDCLEEPGVKTRESRSTPLLPFNLPFFAWGKATAGGWYSVAGACGE